MKILQINTVIKGSSVGRIMADLYQVIRAEGHEARVAVGREPMLEGYEGILIGNKKDFYMHVAKNFLLGEAGFASEEVTARFLRYIDEEKPDIIHLHNIHGFYLQVEQLFDYLKKKKIPVVWTLHDCWSYTGHCAYYDYAACEKWKTGCHTCMQHAKVYPYSIFRDNTISSYKRKRKAFCGVENLTIVTPSKWLAEQVGQSFLKEYPVKVIPNGINLSVFTPKEEKTETEIETPVILGVANIWELRKGLVYFEKLAEDLAGTCQVELIGVSKKQKKELKKKHGTKMILRGKTADTEELVEEYKKAAVFVNATLEDNFPTTNLEALACGTPVVTYATGGSGEAVTKESGLVVQRANYDKLLQGVKEVLENKDPNRFSVSQCRKRAEDFDQHVRYREYLQLYEEILGKPQ